MRDLTGMVTSVQADLARLPRVLDALLGDLEAVAWRERPAPTEWSPLEIVCHLRDEEAEDFGARLRVVVEGGTRFAAIDPERWVEQRAYRDTDPRAALATLAERRAANLAFLDGVPPDRLRHAVTHARLGTLSGLDLLAAWVRGWGPDAGRRCARSTRGRSPMEKAPYNSRMSQGEDRYHAERARIEQGHVKYRDKLRAEGKLFVRDRLKLLLDPGSEFQEDWLFARNQEADTPADGVVTGVGKVGGRTVCLMANDYTVKAGSWGEKTVLKIVRIQEKAARLRVPMLYLVDAAGGRISEQIKIFPGRFHAGRIFYNEVQLSGVVPQICILFGPSPAGSAYLPALTDLVIMVDGKASLYVGSPRMVEMAIGEKTTLEELGGARMHCTVSGCGDVLATSDEEAIELAKRYLSYMPGSYREPPARAAAAEPKPGRSIDEIVPYDQRKWFDMYEVIDRVIDAGSWFEVKKLFAAEVIVGLARIDGRAVGIVANQPKVKGGVLMVDSSDKAARFIWLCNAFNIPLVYLADVAGFMVGSKVEREGIIRHGAKMVFATSQATVPKISVIVRKCYGAGLYAMCGPAFEPDATLALPQGQIAIMGPEPAVNAVYYNKIMELPESERAAYVKAKRDEYAQDVDVYKLASEMLIDDIVPGASLRAELVKRLAYAESKVHEFPQRRNGVFPV